MILDHHSELLSMTMPKRASASKYQSKTAAAEKIAAAFDALRDTLLSEQASDEKENTAQERDSGFENDSDESDDKGAQLALHLRSGRFGQCITRLCSKVPDPINESSSPFSQSRATTMISTGTSAQRSQETDSESPGRTEEDGGYAVPNPLPPVFRSSMAGICSSFGIARRSSYTASCPARHKPASNLCE